MTNTYILYICILPVIWKVFWEASFLLHVVLFWYLPESTDNGPLKDLRRFRDLRVRDHTLSLPCTFAAYKLTIVELTKR